MSESKSPGIFKIAFVLLIFTIVQIGVIGGAYYYFVYEPGVKQAIEAEKKATELSEKIEGIAKKFDTLSGDIQSYKKAADDQVKAFKTNLNQTILNLGFTKVEKKP